MLPISSSLHYPTCIIGFQLTILYALAMGRTLALILYGQVIISCTKCGICSALSIERPSLTVAATPIKADLTSSQAFYVDKTLDQTLS